MSKDTPIVNPHDLVTRRAFSHSQVAQEFFTEHLPASIQQHVNLSTLRSTEGTHIDKHLKKSVTDMLFTVDIADKPGYLYLHVEAVRHEVAQNECERILLGQHRALLPIIRCNLSN